MDARFQELRRRILTHHIGVDQSRLTALLSEGKAFNVDRLTEGFTPEDLKRVSNKILSVKGEIRRDPREARLLLIRYRLSSLSLVALLRTPLRFTLDY